jgi:hypothetical protein
MQQRARKYENLYGFRVRALRVGTEYFWLKIRSRNGLF